VLAPFAVRVAEAPLHIVASDGVIDITGAVPTVTVTVCVPVHEPVVPVTV